MNSASSPLELTVVGLQWAVLYASSKMHLNKQRRFNNSIHGGAASTAYTSEVKKKGKYCFCHNIFKLHSSCIYLLIRFNEVQPV